MRPILGPLAVVLLLAGLLPASVLAATLPKFTVQPVGGTAGVAWSQQPQVTILTGNTIETGATGTITLSRKAGTGPAGAVLSCTALTVPLVNGVAAFSGCSIDLAGTYRLTATWSQGGATDSAAFVIAGPGNATKVAFTVQPARGTPGGAFAVQPSVALQNAAGVTQTGAPPTAVTLGIKANPGGAILTCSGGLSTLTQNGVAAFSGCALDKVGVGYTLVATAAGLTSAPSALFDVADRLAFTTQPTGSAGGPFATQPVVAVRAGASATATHDQGTAVSLSIKAGTGAPGAVLTCTGGLTKTVVNGVAKFAGCTIDKASPASPADPYVLVATAAGLPLAESAPFAVGVGPAAKLVFVAQPATAAASQPFPTQPVVAITDAAGNVVTTGAASTKTVSLAIGANPGGGALTCTGGLDKAAVAGIATFAGCAINKGGVGYTLVATSSGLTKATSSPFNVVAGATLTITTSASVITWGSSVTVMVRFDQSGANRPVQLQVARDGVTWTTLANLTTNASGQATFAYRPATNLYYRAVFAGAPDLGAQTSTTRTVVRQIALLRPTNSGAIKSIRRNTSITFTTTARPARAELPAVKVSFVFYRRVGRVWTLVTKRDVFINAAGKASTTFKFTRAGSWYVRSIANPTPFNANSVWSPLERYTVR